MLLRYVLSVSSNQGSVPAFNARVNRNFLDKSVPSPVTSSLDTRRDKKNTIETKV